MNRAEALIDLSAIEFNVKKLIADSGKPALAVVKADAYGHGLVPVAERALEAGATWLGVALLEEALTLRSSGISAPIIAWLTPITDDFAAALRNKIDLGVPSLAHLESIISAATETGITPRIHLEVDTGMTRGGALSEWQSLLHAVADLHRSKKVEVVGIWSHFARADEPGHPFNEVQLENFLDRLNEAEKYGIKPAVTHFSNSAATLSNRAAHFNLVRLGIVMYGLSPDVNTMGDSKILGLKPAMTLRARLQLVKDVPAGSPVGYGGTVATSRDTKVGVVAMGYADGVPRNASPVAGVLAGNSRAPILGRVSMDQFVVDLGPESKLKPGDWVYLFGEPTNSLGTSDGYTADMWGAACGTINYEIVTRIGPRVPRIYLN